LRRRVGRWKLDGNTSGSYPIAGFDISRIEPSGFATGMMIVPTIILKY
jgi:hypothetical protein